MLKSGKNQVMEVKKSKQKLFTNNIIVIDDKIED